VDPALNPQGRQRLWVESAAGCVEFLERKLAVGVNPFCFVLGHLVLLRVRRPGRPDAHLAFRWSHLALRAFVTKITLPYH
jgi:hypothetical protein